jgi:hypothetical protein
MARPITTKTFGNSFEGERPGIWGAFEETPLQGFQFDVGEPRASLRFALG